MHYLLIYELTPEYISRRGEFRNEHLKMAWESCSRGEMVTGGAVQEPIDTAILVFKGDSPKAAEDFAKSDPYVLNGLVKKWTVRPWVTVVGDMADTPVRV